MPDAPAHAAAEAESTLLLSAKDGEAVTVVNPDGAADFVLVCDHAGHAIPEKLATLGLSERELVSHIAWDIGVRGVCEEMARKLDAALVMQNFSRLVIDCNRNPAAEDSITGIAEWGPISGNVHVAPDEAKARREEIFDPYHDALRALLDRRQEERRRTVLIAIHSFTPSLRGVDRPWHIGVMYGRDRRLAEVLISLLKRDERLQVGANQPYPLDDEVDYTLPMHGERRRIHHVGIEIRNDLIKAEEGQVSWARRLSSLLKQAATAVPGEPAMGAASHA